MATQLYIYVEAYSKKKGNTQMEHYVYVLKQDGTPFMPMERYGKVRRMLKNGQAVPVRNKPFTIRLTYDPETDVTQPVTVSLDPGRTNIGVSAIREDGKMLFREKCITRNKEIPKLMFERSNFRRARRRGERLARKRLAKRLGTTAKRLLQRILPGCKKPLAVKDIINTESRFNNRKRPIGRLTPTARQLLQTHINMCLLVEKILPIRHFASELNRFDFVRMENSKVKYCEYGRGPLYKKDSLENAIREVQKDKCLLCGKAHVEHVHHLIPLSKGGSDTLGNVAGLCLDCHEKIHHDPKAAAKLSKKKDGFNKKYGALSVLNQIISRLFSWAVGRYEDVYATYGWETKKFREDKGLSKDHDIDSYVIGMIGLPAAKIDRNMPPCYKLLQFRRHDRSRIKAQVFRSYYYKGKKVAQNRRKATTATLAKSGKVIEKKQTFDALDTWYEHMAELYGTKEADRMRSQLTVKKSYRRYNDLDRIMDGGIFIYKGKRYTKTSQLTNGQYLRAYDHGERNFPTKECQVFHNTGLVVV